MSPSRSLWTAGLALVLATSTGSAASQPVSCAATLTVGDTQHFAQARIQVDQDCQVFTLTLRHTGNAPVNAMGHNWVLTREADMAAVARDGVGAGLANGFLVPGDTRVIAHTRLLGGRQDTTISFSTHELVPGEPYAFFCSFPGHAHTMHGRLTRGP